MIKYKNKSLSFAFDDDITQEINGVFTLTFKIPKDYDVKIKEEHMVEASVPKKGLQKFRVKSITKKLGYTRYFCKHIFFDLQGNYIDGLSVDRKNGQNVMDYYLSSLQIRHKFYFESDISSIHSINLNKTNALDALLKGKHSIIGQWSGELDIDNYYVGLKHSIGVDTEEIITVKKNISDFESSIDTSNVVTRLILSKKVKEQVKEMVKVERKSKATTKTSSKVKPKEKYKEVTKSVERVLEATVDSPLIDNYPVIYSHIQEVSDENVKSLDDLKEYGKKKFENSLIDLPKTFSKIKVSDDLILGLGDTAIVFIQDFNIFKRLKVMKYNYSPISNKIKSVEFGGVASTFTKTLNDRQKDIEDVVKQETEVRLSQVIENTKKLIDKQLKELDMEIDAEEVKALSKAETEAYIRSEAGQAELIQAITADVVWLKSILVDAEVINTIVANIDYARIKKMIVDTAFINEIISKNEFQQQFEDGGVDVVNIFSKMRDSITMAINQKITDANGKLKEEIGSEVLAFAEYIESRVENKVNKVDYDAKMNEINSEQLLQNSKIKQTSDSILLEVKKLQSNINSNKSDISKIKVNTDSIKSSVSSKASKTELNGLVTRISNAESSINQNANNIELKVKSLNKSIYDLNKNLVKDYDQNKRKYYTSNDDNKWIGFNTEKLYAKNQYYIEFDLPTVHSLRKARIAYNTLPIKWKWVADGKNRQRVKVQFDRDINYLEFGLFGDYAAVDNVEVFYAEDNMTGEEMVSSINLLPSSVKINAKNIELNGDVLIRAINGTNTKISGDKIYSGTIKGVTIEGAIIQGNSRIKIGDKGFLKPANDGIFINVPANKSSNHGVTVQFTGRKKADIPKGLLIVNNNKISQIIGFGTGAAISNDVLLTIGGFAQICNKFRGDTVCGSPIISNSKYDVPVAGGMYPITFIGYRTGIGQLCFDDGTGNKGTFWVDPDDTSSDVRLKKNIKISKHKGLSIIKKLKFYEFDWKPNKHGYIKPHTRIGQIAQETQNVDETLVCKKGEMLAIDDFRMLNIALKSIQELNEKIEKIERCINGYNTTNNSKFSNKNC